MVVGREERKKASVGGYDDIYPVGKMGKRGLIGAPTKTGKKISQTLLEKEAVKSPSTGSMLPPIMKWKLSATYCK